MSIKLIATVEQNQPSKYLPYVSTEKGTNYPTL